jgi:ubiquinone/menaquinone biosynthesis C-methylase UbiE
MDERTLPAILVGAAAVRPADRVLDVAAGRASCALAVANGVGARVVSVKASAELDLADASFDVVLACLAVADDRTGAELLRVCRPGGRIGLVSWTSYPLGGAAHLRDVLGDAVTWLDTRIGLVRDGDLEREYLLAVARRA